MYPPSPNNLHDKRLYVSFLQISCRDLELALGPACGLLGSDICLMCVKSMGFLAGIERFTEGAHLSLFCLFMYSVRKDPVIVRSMTTYYVLPLHLALPLCFPIHPAA